ncbi:hypothetical protein DIPPA_16403 [Diplonema papillatum]|nr:hypothetical protein DIPPA_16403 [Diplonema papillatum]
MPVSALRQRAIDEAKQLYEASFAKREYSDPSTRAIQTRTHQIHAGDRPLIERLVTGRYTASQPTQVWDRLAENGGIGVGGCRGGKRGHNWSIGSVPRCDSALHSDTAGTEEEQVARRQVGTCGVDSCTQTGSEVEGAQAIEGQRQPALPVDSPQSVQASQDRGGVAPNGHGRGFPGLPLERHLLVSPPTRAAAAAAAAKASASPASSIGSFGHSSSPAPCSRRPPRGGSAYSPVLQPPNLALYKSASASPRGACGTAAQPAQSPSKPNTARIGGKDARCGIQAASASPDPHVSWEARVLPSGRSARGGYEAGRPQLSGSQPPQPTSDAERSVPSQQANPGARGPGTAVFQSHDAQRPPRQAFCEDRAQEQQAARGGPPGGEASSALPSQACAGASCRVYSPCSHCRSGSASPPSPPPRVPAERASVPQQGRAAQGAAGEWSPAPSVPMLHLVHATPAEIALLGRQLSSERAASCSPAQLSPRFARAARQSVESARGPASEASSGTAASSRARYRPKDHAGILSYADTSPFLWTR